jgi:molybdopterin-guanine dinucleotide biosynthesis protein A
MKNITKSDITAVILSGGQATRMNHQDKGLIPFKGKPLIDYVSSTIQKEVCRVLVSANRNLDAYQKFGEVITDSLPGFQGPLAGVLSALNEVKTQYLLVAPCDAPFINRCLITKLLKHMQQSNADICVATDGQRIHPTFALINTNLKDNLSDFLAQGHRKMGLWFKNNDAQAVDFSDCTELFINLNSPEDFDAV